MDLDDLFSENEEIGDLAPDNRDMAVLRGFYGDEYFQEVREYIIMRLGTYLYSGKISIASSEGFSGIVDKLFNTGVGVLKRIIDARMEEMNFDNYGDFLYEEGRESLPYPMYHVLLNESVEEYGEMDSERENIVLGIGSEGS